MSKQIGRPSSFTAETGDLICDRLAGGESLRAICRDDGMPVLSTVMRWLTLDPAFSDQYTRAREAQAEVDADKVGDIADRVLSGEIDPQSARVAMDAFKWSAGKRLPKKYGERMTLAGDRENPLQGITDDQLDARLAELLAKESGNGG